MTSYAYHGSHAFNTWLDTILNTFTREVEAALGSNLEALILGGGYGRGEGGIEIIDGTEFPYNDLDFTLVVNAPASVPHTKLNTISNTYAEQLGIHVDFSRPLTLKAIQHWPPWLMWHDLLNGHIVLSGPEDVLTAHAPDSVKAPPPPIEALRLLLNRGAGLLWAMRVVRDAEPEPDRGFTLRNAYKLLLALGDALLISYGRYATSYRGRDALLEPLAKDRVAVRDLQLVVAYRDALRFKFSPHEFSETRIDNAALVSHARLWAQVLRLTEERRTGRSWRDIDDYAADGFIREHAMHQLPELSKNVIRNLRCRRLSWKHPRERLYRDITRLLTRDPAPADWHDRSAAALKIWNQYN